MLNAGALGVVLALANYCASEAVPEGGIGRLSARREESVGVGGGSIAPCCGPVTSTGGSGLPLSVGLFGVGGVSLSAGAGAPSTSDRVSVGGVPLLRVICVSPKPFADGVALAVADGEAFGSGSTVTSTTGGDVGRASLAATTFARKSFLTVAPGRKSPNAGRSRKMTTGKTSRGSLGLVMLPR